VAGQKAPPQAITVAAASDLQTVLPDLVARFEKRAGAKVTTSLGSSGSVFAQIQNGAPFDVFMSADIDYPRKLVAAGLAEGDSLYEYATGRLVLWTRKASGIDIRTGLAVLTDARVRRIAIANPQLAPYGRAAVAALRYEKIYDAVQTKLVLGENISQTAQLADSGNADVAIVSHSLALGPALVASGTYIEIPVGAHPPIQQAAVVIRASRSRETARGFLAFLEDRGVGAVLQRFGFVAPR
jgi:molybdate transport system substrate-binding protein